MPEYQAVRGWRFPADVSIPDSQWSQTSQGSWTLGWQGFIDIAHQKGLESMDAEVVATGVDPEMNIPYAIARGEVTIDGDTYDAVQDFAEQYRETGQDPGQTSVTDGIRTSEATDALLDRLADAVNGDN